MDSEIQIYNHDKIRLELLDGVLGGTVGLGVQLGDGPEEDYVSTIHANGRRVVVRENFTISEDASGKTLTFRAMQEGPPLRLHLHPRKDFWGKKISVTRQKEKAPEWEREITSATATIELLPQGQGYVLRIVTAELAIGATQPQASSPNAGAPKENSAAASSFDEDFVYDVPAVQRPIRGGARSARASSAPSLKKNAQEQAAPADPSLVKAAQEEAPPAEQEKAMEAALGPRPENDPDLLRIEQDIAALQSKRAALDSARKEALERLEKLDAEYRKDYEAFEKQYADAKSRTQVDTSVIEYYKDRDIVPVEDILKLVTEKLGDAEGQIRTFIEARQRKTMEIEHEIKSNRRK